MWFRRWLDGVRKWLRRPRNAAGPITLRDYIAQLRELEKLGQFRPFGAIVDPRPDRHRELRRTQGTYDAMTEAERRAPEALSASRLRRIACGAGVDVDQVRRFVNDFERYRAFVIQVRAEGIMGRLRLLKDLFTGDLTRMFVAVGDPVAGKTRHVKRRRRHELKHRR